MIVGMTAAPMATAETSPPPDWGVDTEPDASGQFGAFCQDNADCDSGFCIQADNGLQCTEFCIDECPGDYECTLFQTAGTDVVFICRPPGALLGEPCAAGPECQSDLCLQTEEGLLCSASCALAACPQDWTCGQSNGEYVCLPPWQRGTGLGQQCSGNDECLSERCVHVTGGWICSVPCDGDCPAGLVCGETSADGQALAACVPPTSPRGPTPDEPVPPEPSNPEAPAPPIAEPSPLLAPDIDDVPCGGACLPWDDAGASDTAPASHSASGGCASVSGAGQTASPLGLCLFALLLSLAARSAPPARSVAPANAPARSHRSSSAVAPE